MPADGLSFMLPVGHASDHHTFAHVNENDLSANSAAPMASFAWGGENHNELAKMNHGGHGYVKPSAFGNDNDHNKYVIEQEGPGFREELKREIDRIIMGPEGPYHRRSVEQMHGKPIDYQVNLAPNQELDKNVQAYFKLMRRMFDASRDMKTTDENGNPIKLPFIPDEDANPPEVAAPIVIAPAELEAHRSWFAKLGDFFSGGPSADQLAQERAEKLFGPAMPHDEMHIEPLDHDIDLPSSRSSDQKIGYADSFMRVFGNSSGSGSNAHQQLVPIPPALFALGQTFKDTVEKGVTTLQEGMASRSCSCSLSTYLAPSRGRRPPPSSMG